MGWSLRRVLGLGSASKTTAARQSRPVVESVESRTLFSVVHLTTHFADGNFLPGNWSISMTNIGGGGTQSASRVVKNGHPGAFREVFNTVYAAAGGSVDYGFNQYKMGGYSPSLKGAINSITYSEDDKLLAGGGQGQASGPALVQNGILYVASVFITPKTTWTHQVHANLTAANFIAANGSKTHPDFSQGAASMSFGFFRANSAGIPGYSIYAGIDNFNLLIKSTKTITKK